MLFSSITLTYTDSLSHTQLLTYPDSQWLSNSRWLTESHWLIMTQTDSLTHTLTDRGKEQRSDFFFICSTSGKSRALMPSLCWRFQVSTHDISITNELHYIRTEAVMDLIFSSAVKAISCDMTVSEYCPFKKPVTHCPRLFTFIWLSKDTSCML